MPAERTREIATWTLDLPPGWFAVPLGELDAHGQAQWIDEVVAQVRETAEEPGSPTALREELAQLRGELLAQQNPWLNAAVSIRPETVMTIGCVLLTSLIGLEPDEGPDAFEAVLEEGFATPRRGVRSHVSRVWRDGTTTGAMVGGFQRFETVDLGAGIGTVEDRTIFGVFPEGSREMIRLEFRTAELALFEDMPEETAALARTARVVLQEPA